MQCQLYQHIFNSLGNNLLSLALMVQ